MGFFGFRQIAGIACLILAGGGCAHERTLTMRFIDAESKQPVPDVEAVRMSRNWAPTIGLLVPTPIYWTLPGDHPTSNEKGEVKLKKITTSQKIRFQKEGFESVMLESIWPAVRLDPYADAAYTEPNQDGVVVVPLKHLEKEEPLPEVLEEDSSEASQDEGDGA